MTQNSAIDFNEKYNLIFDEQDKLPNKKGKIKNSIVETKIIDLANDLIRDINKINNEVVFTIFEIWLL